MSCLTPPVVSRLLTFLISPSFSYSCPRTVIRPWGRRARPSLIKKRRRGLGMSGRGSQSEGRSVIFTSRVVKRARGRGRKQKNCHIPLKHKQDVPDASNDPLMLHLVLERNTWRRRRIVQSPAPHRSHAQIRATTPNSPPPKKKHPFICFIKLQFVWCGVSGSLGSSEPARQSC